MCLVTSDAFLPLLCWQLPLTRSWRSGEKPIRLNHHPLGFIMKINTEMQQQCVNSPPPSVPPIQSQRKRRKMSHRNPLRFSICVQLFPLVIYCERSQRHLLGNKWLGGEKIGNVVGHADGGTDRLLLKAMTSRRRATDIWVFVVAAAALSGHFNLIQLRRESAWPRLRLPSLHISLITRAVVYSWV